MEDKRLKELINRKIDLEEEINKLKLEVKTLENTRKYDKNKEKTLRQKEEIENQEDSYEKNENINENINKNKKKIQELENCKKGIARIIKTIKGSNTKIKNRRNAITDLNSEIENINKEINEMDSEKRKKLIEIEKLNIPKFNKLKNKIKHWEDLQELYKDDEKKLEQIKEQLNEVKIKLDNAERKMAETFEQICKKYDGIIAEKKALIIKKVEELKVANRFATTAQKTKNNSFSQYEELKQNIEINVKTLIKPKKSENNTLVLRADVQKFVKDIDLIIKNKEIKNENEKKQQLVETKPQIEEKNKKNEAEPQKIESSQITKTKAEIKAQKTERDEIVQENNELLKNSSQTEVKEVNESCLKQNNEEEKNLSKATSEQLINTESYDINQENIEDDDEMIYTGEEGGPVYQQAYANMLKRNGTIFEVYSINGKCENTLVFNPRYKKIIKRIILKENGDRNSKEKYIEIDGKRYELKRKLEKETREEVDKMCKKYLKIGERMTIKERLELQQLKAKIDPAVVNAIKDRLKSKLDKWHATILQYSSEKRKDGLTQEQQNFEIEKANSKCKTHYEKLLKQYIRFLYEKDQDELSFYIAYDCSGDIALSDYLSASIYMNSAESAGIQIIEKPNIFELIKNNRFSNNQTQSASSTEENGKKNTEGDKSFVPKVNGNFKTAIRGVSKVTQKIKENANQLFR